MHAVMAFKRINGIAPTCLSETFRAEELLEVGVPQVNRKTFTSQNSEPLQVKSH
jgi:hypothetical protein